MEVIWSARAKQDYLNVLEYLHKNWGLKEVRGFVGKTEETIRTIVANPKSFISSSKRKDVHKGFVN